MSSPDVEPSRRRVLVVFGNGRVRGLGRALLDGLLVALRERGADVRVHDLLADGFDPVLHLEEGALHAGPVPLDVDPLAARYQEDVRWAERFLVVHPVWWFAPPAILKGWIDRILVHDVALRQRPGVSPSPLLAGRSALVVQTFNTSRAIDRVAFLGLSAFFWKRVVFHSVGVERVARLPLYSVESLSEARLEQFRVRLLRAVNALLE